MTTTVLFLCPHHAAKSVIAAAYFNRLAQQRGLPVRADSAGTDPADVVSPVVMDLLRRESIDVSDHQPRQVTQTDLTQAQRIIWSARRARGINSNRVPSAVRRVSKGQGGREG